MKITTIGLSALLGVFGSLSAIERSTGEKAKEEIPAEPEGGILGNDQKEQANKADLIEKSAYLGVGGQPAGTALLMHLNLESGFLLNTIDPRSPAGLAGLEENDIIEAVEGKKLTDQDSLRDALSVQKPGEEVLLKLIRRGKSIDQKIKLGEALARQKVNPGERVPNRAADINRLIEEQLGNALGGFGNAELQKQLMERLEKALGDQGAGFRELRLDLGARLLNGEDGKRALRALRGADGADGIGSMRLEDEEGSIEMKIQNGQRELAVRDKGGKLLFEGPYDSDIDKAAVPEEYRERVGRLDIGNQNSLKLKLNGKDLLKKLKEKREKGN